MNHKIICLVLLPCCIFFTYAFQAGSDISFYKNEGNLQVVVDGKLFELREKDKYRAQLLYKTALTQGAGTMEKFTVTSLMFYGNTTGKEERKHFEERLEVEFAFNEGAMGEVSGIKIELHHNQKDYFQIAEQSKFKITKLQWSADRRYYVMSADFDCQVREWGFPWETQPVVKLKGKMENIQVSVPAWVNLKNPNQVAFDR